ncbi:MAG: DMT family transporter [Candidatus Levyibacteriota bacterium]
MGFELALLRYNEEMKRTSKQKSAPIGASLVVLSSLFYASYGIWTELMGDFFDGYTASAVRSILVLLILIPLALTYRQLEPLNLRRNWRYLVGLVLTATLIWGPFYYAILHAGVGISLAINYAGMMIGMFFFGWLLAGEQFTKYKWFSAFLGLLGLWLVFMPSISSLGWLALVGALISGLSSAAHYVIAKRVSYKATQSTIFVWTASVVANIPMAFLLGERTPAVGWHVQWLYLVIFAIASVISTWTFIKGVKLIDAGAAGILGLLEIVFGLIFGVIFFSERPGLVVFFGVVVIITAAAIPYLQEYNAKRGMPEETKS